MVVFPAPCQHVVDRAALVCEDILRCERIKHHATVAIDRFPDVRCVHSAQGHDDQVSCVALHRERLLVGEGEAGITVGARDDRQPCMCNVQQQAVGSPSNLQSIQEVKSLS